MSPTMIPDGDGAPSDAMVDAANEAVSLRAENTRFQEQVEEAKKALADTQRNVIEPLKMQRNSAETERDRYKALEAALVEVLKLVVEEAESAGVAAGDDGAIERLLSTLPAARAALADTSPAAAALLAQGERQRKALRSIEGHAQRTRGGYGTLDDQVKTLKRVLRTIESEARAALASWEEKE